MIGAVCYKLDNCSRAEIYLVGSYDRIDWSAELSCDLGERYSVYEYRNDQEQENGICIERGLDDKPVLRLKETRRYIVRIAGGNKNLPHFQNEGNKLLRCDRDIDYVSFQFVNYLGRSNMSFSDPSCTIPFEVVPEKMGYEDDYIQLTEALAQMCSELLLEYSGSTSNVFRQSDEDPRTLLEQFIFLRQFCYSQNLQSIFESVKRNPDRILEQEEEMKPLGMGSPSVRFFRNPLIYGRGWQKVETVDTGETIWLPQKVSVARKYDRLDTPANRFIKYALRKFDAVCIGLMEALNTEGGTRQAECLTEAQAIHDILDQIFADSFFDEVGELDIMPLNNQVLQKREGYSQIFAAWSMIDLALQLDWKGKDDVYAGESKNVALLYEYWLFFELYRIIGSIDGCIPVQTDDHPFLMENDGITISLRAGNRSAQYFEIRDCGIKINLYYNREFLPSAFRTTRYEGSYSRPFRPDYTIAIYPDKYTGWKNGEDNAVREGSVSYLHFDAKYRVEDLKSFVGYNEDADDGEEIEEEKAESVLNTYKRGDLLKMHTYNDAIRRTVGSYVLYPGSSIQTGDKAFCLYDEIIPGVGAFSIKPSNKNMGEETLKEFILRVISSGVAIDSRLNRMNYFSEMILSEPSRFGGEDVNEERVMIRKGDLYVLGFIRSGEYTFLQRNDLLKNGSEFYFYFYAIKGKDVYSHHKDLFRASYFRYYRFEPRYNNGRYLLEPVLCSVVSNELVSRAVLTERLAEIGFITQEEKHLADYYYLLKVRVIDDNFSRDVLEVSDVLRQNGNDTFSAGSPKVLYY